MGRTKVEGRKPTAAVAERKGTEGIVEFSVLLLFGEPNVNKNSILSRKFKLTFSFFSDLTSFWFLENIHMQSRIVCLSDVLMWCGVRFAGSSCQTNKLIF